MNKSVGASLGETPTSVLTTSDNGIIIAGLSNSNISGDKSENSRGEGDYWIIKFDGLGNKVWDKTFGGSGFEREPKIIATSDGNYIIAGSSESPISGDKTEDKRSYYFDYWIIKIDTLGNKIWDKTLGAYGIDFHPSVAPTTDGGCILAGYSDSYVAFDKSQNPKGLNDFWIIRLNSNGVKVWDKTFGGSNDEYNPEVIATHDGNFLIIGNSRSGISGDKSDVNKGNYDFWMIKIDANGLKIWDKTIGGGGLDYDPKVVQTSDSGFLICGTSFSNLSADKSENSKGINDYWIIKTDAQGQKLWDKTIGGSDYDTNVNISLLPNGDFYVIGKSKSNISGDKTENSKGDYDYWLLRLNNLGYILWDKTIGGSNEDNDPIIALTNNNEILISGESFSNISGDKTENSKGYGDYWALKLKIICPNSFTFSIGNQTIGNYLATETIVSQSTIIDKVLYQAGNSILLNPPFEVNNKLFKAQIQRCY